MVKAKQLAGASANAAVAATNSTDDSSDSEHGREIQMIVAEANIKDCSAKWLFDSGATRHMSCDMNLLAGMEPTYVPIKVANTAVINATQKGSCIVTTL
ncbi:hypothetical protein PI125_g21291 [Phytophthora idaei]|nr:hypothetical protein PI125_g21291 [Phytophthora idaei]